MANLVKTLESTHTLSDEALAELLQTDRWDKALQEAADRVRRIWYGNTVYVRGLIEFTNYCKNNCLYCGIRRGNQNAHRYRLTKNDILRCCDEGYALGYRTFVLQGGEDPYFTDDRICDIVAAIHKKFSDCAITLSIGEKSFESYLAYYNAGAERYLLRHETADCSHYSLLHPSEMSLENRKRCLRDLKRIGYQTGAGMMVGSPFQKLEHLIADLRFLEELQPEMIGIGPFLPQKDTPFRDEAAGDLHLVLRLLAILRLMHPTVLLPATTALGTLDPKGRELGMAMGANVVMPNLSPIQVRKKYMLYDNKISTGDESAQSLKQLYYKMESAGYHIVTDRGDARSWTHT